MVPSEIVVLFLGILAIALATLAAVALSPTLRRPDRDTDPDSTPTP